VPITSDLFEAYLKCATKCFLRSRGEIGTGNTYANWVKAEQLSYSSEGIKHLVEGVAEDECVTGAIDSKELRSPKWRLAIQTIARTQNLESSIHAIERLISEEGGKSALLIPIRMVFTKKVHRHDALSVAFNALVLSEMLGREVGTGKVIHGNNRATLKVNTIALAGEVRKLTEKIGVLISSTSPPELILNRHCPECEFQNQCRQKAIEKDDLSMLSGITEAARSSHRNRGIFTVTQLIGALIVSGGKESFHSFWADHESQELDIFLRFIDVVCHLTDWRILHFGGYETAPRVNICKADNFVGCQRGRCHTTIVQGSGFHFRKAFSLPNGSGPPGLRGHHKR
jgi:CRISPR/Cas system-associated exonuclease Cas4 (RecB family)